MRNLRLYLLLTWLYKYAQIKSETTVGVVRARLHEVHGLYVHGMVPLDVAPRATDFCHVTSPWQHIMSMRIR